MLEETRKEEAKQNKKVRGEEVRLEQIRWKGQRQTWTVEEDVRL